MPEINPEEIELREKDDELLIRQLRIMEPLKCAGCTNEIAMGEPFLRFEYVVGYSIDRDSTPGFVRLTAPFARYDTEYRYAHLICLGYLPQHY